MRIPPVTQELIEFLKEIYPIRMPKLTETEREIFVRVGHQEVIRTLEKFYAEQERRNILTRN